VGRTAVSAYIGPSPTELWQRIVTDDKRPDWVGVFTDFAVIDVPAEWREACTSPEPSPEVLSWLDREWQSLKAAFKANRLDEWSARP